VHAPVADTQLHTPLLDEGVDLGTMRRWGGGVIGRGVGGMDGMVRLGGAVEGRLIEGEEGAFGGASLELGDPFGLGLEAFELRALLVQRLEVLRWGERRWDEM
jgi:hypothetical protein